MKLLFHTFSLLFLLGPPEFRAPARAAESTPSQTIAAGNAVPIKSLVMEVLRNNPELAFYEAEIAAARGERQTAGALANPELETEIGRKSVRGGDLAEEGMAWSVGLRQSFDWPGRIPLRKAIANQQLKLAELGYSQFKAALAAKAQTLAYNLLATQRKAEVAREVADRFHLLREVLVQRDPAGLTPTLELRVIESTELTMQRRATEESLEMQSALLELNQIRGSPFDSNISVSDTELALAPPPSPEVLWEAARTNNFELQLRKAELEQQGFRVSLAHNERYPSVTVGPFFAQERAGERENIVGVSLSIPLPVWNRNKGNIETAKARELQAQTALFVAHRELERRIAEQFLRYETKLAEISKWRPDSIEHFREAADLADRHYRLGAVPVATYIELQKQYLEAVEALLDTKREALEAQQQLQVLTGWHFRSITSETEEKK